MQVNITVHYGDNDIDITRSSEDYTTISTSINDPKRIVLLLDETIEAVKRAINAGN